MRSSQRLYQVFSFSTVTLLACTASAQEDGPLGNETRFGISSELSSESNAAMDRPSEGDTNTFATTLSAGISRRTSIEQLDIDGSAALTFSEEPNDAVQDVTDPSLRLFYQREGAGSTLRAVSRAEEQDVTSVSSIYDPETGEVTITPDDGRRRLLNQSVTLEMLKDMPIELDISAERGDVRYYDTTAPTYYDSSTAGGSLATRLRLSPVTTMNARLRYKYHEADNLQNTERETRSGEAGISYAIDPTSALSFATGYTTVATTASGLEEEEAGATFNLGYDKELIRGTIGIDLDREIAATGARDALTFTRSFEMPSAALAGEFGLSQNESGDSTWIGKMTYSREFKRGTFGMNLMRDVSATDTGGDRVVSTLGSAWTHEINSLSQLSLNGNYGEVDYLNGSNPTSWQADLSLDYDHQLTRDWVLTTGVSQRRNMQEGLDDAISNKVYMQISRDFTFSH